MKMVVQLLVAFVMSVSAFSASAGNMSQYQLKLNEELNLDGTIVTLTGVGDSRCPATSQCIWEGLVQTTFEIDDMVSEKSEFRLSFHLGQSESRVINGYLIQIVDVLPLPVPGDTQEKSVWLKVEKINEVTK